MRLSTNTWKSADNFGITAESIASELPFEFDIEKVMLTVTKGHGDQSPVHTVWVPAPSSS